MEKFSGNGIRVCMIAYKGFYLIRRYRYYGFSFNELHNVNFSDKK